MGSGTHSPIAVVVLLGAVAALLGAAPAVPSALGAPSEVTLEVNDNCVELDWPCWTTEGMASRPQPTSSVVIASAGTLGFVDHGREANVAWTGAHPACESSVPEPPTVPKTNWEGTCTFATPGIYEFESATMFKDALEDYTKYQVTVVGTPTDETISASGETQTGATLDGRIEPQGNAVEYHFEYEGPGIAGEQSTTPRLLSAADFASHAVSEPVGGLQPGATYRFRLVATYGAGKTPVSGATQQEFTTLAASAPTATTLAAEGLGETQATLEGAVNPGGEASEYFFEYGTGTEYGEATAKATVSGSGGSHTVSAILTGLTPDTEYHFRLLAENEQGSVEGLDRSFKTMPLPAKEPQAGPSANEPAPTTGPVVGVPPASEPLVALVQPPSPEPLLGSLSLHTAQHGRAVRGSLEIFSAGAGGRLEVAVFAAGSSLSIVHHRGAVRVGGLVHSAVHAGVLSFTAPLTARAHATLRHRHRLALTVQIVLTPLSGPVARVSGSVTLHE